MIRYIFFAFLFIGTVFSSTPLQAGEPIFVFPSYLGEISDPSPRDFGIHLGEKGLLNEIWTIEGYTDEGEVVRAAIGLSEAIVRKNNAFVTASFLKPDGNLQQFNFQKKRGVFEASPEGLDLKLENNYFRDAGDTKKGNSYRLHIGEENFMLSSSSIVFHRRGILPEEVALSSGKTRSCFGTSRLPAPGSGSREGSGPPMTIKRSRDGHIPTIPIPTPGLSSFPANGHHSDFTVRK